MPGFDGTGPEGRGAMTGGGRGDCVVSADGIGRPGIGRGIGRGMGRGGVRGGMRNRYYSTGLTQGQRAQNPTGTEKDYLMEQAELLKKELSDIQDRIKEMTESQDTK